MTDTFFGEVALEDAAEELGMPEEEMRGPRLLSDTPPHRGLLGTGFLKNKKGKRFNFVITVFKYLIINLAYFYMLIADY